MSFPIAFSYNLETTVAQLSDTISLDSRNDLKLGVEYRYTTLDDQHVGTKLTSEYDMLAAGSATWDYRILPQLTMTNAVRLDTLYVPSLRSYTVPDQAASHAHHYIEPSFNSRLRYDAGSLGVFGVNAARGIQLPALFDFSPDTAFGPALAINNPSLVPSTTINVGINYSHPIAAIDGGLTLALYAQRTTNMLGTPFASNFSFIPPTTLTMEPRNYGRVDDAGGEARLNGKTDFGLSWDLAYAMTAVRDMDKASMINFQRQTPVNSFIGGFSWKIGPVELSAHARWQSHYQDVAANFSTFQLDNVKIHDFVTVDARAAWKIDKRFTLSLSGEQLGSSALKETSGLRIQRRLIGGLTAHF